MAERIIYKRNLKKAVDRIALHRDASRELAQATGGLRIREFLEDIALQAVVEFGEALLKGDSRDVGLLAFGAINRATGHAKGRERFPSPDPLRPERSRDVVLKEFWAMVDKDKEAS